MTTEPVTPTRLPLKFFQRHTREEWARQEEAGEDEGGIYEVEGPGEAGEEAYVPPLEPEVTWPIHREAAKVGRNDPCPCGSGKKYKKCCGK